MIHGNESLRYKDASWYGKTKEITVIGLGGVGLGLALHFKNLDNTMYVWDADKVETHNCRPQGYFPIQIGKSKVDGYKALCKFMYGDISKINAYNKWWQEDSPITPITVMAADDMDTNKKAFEKWALMDDRELFIDVRLQAEEFDVFFVQKGDEERYRATLFNNDEAEDAPCSYQQTRHTAMMMHGYVVGIYLNWIEELPSVPFRSTYISNLNLWKKVK
jgi:hypothetical protein